MTGKNSIPAVFKELPEIDCENNTLEKNVHTYRN